MRIDNCLIITSDDSYIELKPEEIRHFSGNVIVNEALLGNWSKVVAHWRGFAKELADVDPSCADHGRPLMHKEVVG